MYAKSHILTEQIVNSGRQNELDIAKAVLIFSLSLIHCVIECTPEEQLVSGIPFFLDSILGGPLAAPMFMFAMGVGMSYTKMCRPIDFVHRGIQIVITGLVLNVCRYLIPFLVGYGLTGNYEKYINPLLYKVLGNDVLQFAGIAMLLIALFIKLRFNYLTMLIIGVVMSLVGTALTGMDVQNPLGNIFLGYLIGTEDVQGLVISDFPVLNWLIVPIVGYIFGQFLLRMKDKASFYKVVSTFCILVTIIYFPLGIHNGWGMFGEGQNCYYHLRTTDAIVALAANIGLLGIYYYVALFLPKKCLNVIRDISKNINLVYCIHWVFIIVIVDVVLFILRGTQGLKISAILCLGTAISVISICIAHVWSNRKRKSKNI